LLWRPVRQQEMMDHTEQTGVSMKSALRSPKFDTKRDKLLIHIGRA